MLSTVLLSGRVFAEIVISGNAEWLRWLESRQRSSSICVSQLSLIKATRMVQERVGAERVHPHGMLEQFAKRHLRLHTVLGIASVRLSLYNELARRLGRDDLELFGVCAAIQNRYEYCCWNEEDRSATQGLWSELVVRVFESYLVEI